MPKTDERIKALNKTLDESKVLYEDSKRQYDNAVALYEQSKVALAQAASFANTLGNTNLDPATALKTAATFAPNPQEYLNRVNQPGVDPQKVLEMQYQLKNGGGVYVMGDNVFPFMFY